MEPRKADTDNGHLMATFSGLNNMRIDTFFDHSLKYKYTWQDTRGTQSVYLWTTY